jgi:hypothetical protein
MSAEWDALVVKLGSEWAANKAVRAAALEHLAHQLHDGLLAELIAELLKAEPVTR